MSVSVALENVAIGIGEGPHWDVQSQRLHMVDFNPNNKESYIMRWTPSTGHMDRKSLGFAPTVIIPTTVENEYVITRGKEVCNYNWSTDDLETLFFVDPGKRTRFNDGKCDSQGRLLIGTLCEEKTPTVVWETEEGSLFGYTGNNNDIRIMQKDVTISNGITWTNDNQTMFYIDSYLRHVYAYDYDMENFKIGNRRIAIDFSKFSVEELGFPDGCTMDTKDHIWIGCFDAGKVVCYDAATGQKLQEIKFPAKRITSCCFGGKDLSDLYVTSCAVGFSPVELQTTQKLSGSLFKVTGLDSKGSPMNHFNRV